LHSTSTATAIATTTTISTTSMPRQDLLLRASFTTRSSSVRVEKVCEDNNQDLMMMMMMTVNTSRMEEGERKTTRRRRSFRHMARSFFLRSNNHKKQSGDYSSSSKQHQQEQQQKKNQTIVPQDASSNTEQSTIYPDQSWSTDQSHEDEEEEDANSAHLLEWSEENVITIASRDDHDVEVDFDVGAYESPCAIPEDDEQSKASFPTQCSSSSSLLSSSSEQSENDKNDIPLEITVIADGAELTKTTSASLSASTSYQDNPISVHIRRLEEANALAQSYLAKLQSTEHLVDTLTAHLQKTQGYAEHLLVQNETLEDAIQDMERGEGIKNDLLAFIKIMMCFSLFYYACGGTDFCMIVSVVLYLFAELACVLA
jgi:hypothetical protein